jgi:hypothetical protein
MPPDHCTTRARHILRRTINRNNLLERAGRGLRLTEMGGVDFGYADAIFALGRELAERVKGQPSSWPLWLAVGVADGLEKLIAQGETSTLRRGLEQ